MVICGYIFKVLLELNFQAIKRIYLLVRWAVCCFLLDPQENCSRMRSKWECSFVFTTVSKMWLWVGRD